MISDAKEILEKVSRDYGEALYWHIRRLVVSHDDAEDALQETFIKVFSKAQSFSGREESLRAWAYSIATREALQTLRHRKHFFQSMDSVGKNLAEVVDREASPSAGKEEILLQKAILSLGTVQRLVFNLRYYDDMPYEQIAKVTGKSEGTLRTNYHYAVDKIKKYVKENSI